MSKQNFAEERDQLQKRQRDSWAWHSFTRVMSVIVTYAVLFLVKITDVFQNIWYGLELGISFWEFLEQNVVALFTEGWHEYKKCIGYNIRDAFSGEISFSTSILFPMDDYTANVSFRYTKHAQLNCMASVTSSVGASHFSPCWGIWICLTIG